MEWMDFGWDPSGSAVFFNLHLTKDTCIPYSVNHDDHAGEQQSENQLRKYQPFPRSAVYDQGAGGGAVSDINEDGERADGEGSDHCGEAGWWEERSGKVQAGDVGGDG